MAFKWTKKGKAETFLQTEWAGVVNNPRPYVETAEKYYSAVRSWIDVNGSLNEKMEGLFRAAKEAVRGSEAEETANLALWKEMNTNWILEAAKVTEAAGVPSMTSLKDRAITETTNTKDADGATRLSRQLLGIYVVEQPPVDENVKIRGWEHYNYFEGVIKERHTAHHNYTGHDDEWWFVHDFRRRYWEHGHPQVPELRKEEAPGAAGGGAPAGPAPTAGPAPETVEKPAPKPEVPAGTSSDSRSGTRNS